jgi:hypothetical protein
MPPISRRSADRLADDLTTIHQWWDRLDRADCTIIRRGQTPTTSHTTPLVHSPAYADLDAIHWTKQFRLCRNWWPTMDRWIPDWCNHNHTPVNIPPPHDLINQRHSSAETMFAHAIDEYGINTPQASKAWTQLQRMNRFLTISNRIMATAKYTIQLCLHNMEAVRHHPNADQFEDDAKNLAKAINHMIGRFSS